ncbi:DUF433 domain-containing protein [Micromonospora inyonensis]|uniref:Uncharacterized conserved protein, DUF433 family n=1 Tax=Micromonospora inyonensis TaxID=47866 RepID=A0A1C6RKK8_9ACTN|nr:DUF433 domain-containing protein [Micromonospora inyonensis]SCL17563.1 Uncharacterized conserved protein, DUF433 family [Micromonospora inyonensis]
MTHEEVDAWETGKVVSVLEREVFSEAEAARLLRLAQSTLHYWLEGDERKGRRHKPVLRTEPRGGRSVTWAEFVEAGLLREYRRTHRVPMVELRAFIDLLREQFGVPYPLADRRPYVAGKKLVLEAQAEAGLDPEYCLVAAVGNQLLLTPPSAAFVERVTWDGDIAAGWRPDPNPQSPVRILPDVRFGRPSIKGISTEVLWEQDEAGLDVEEIAETYQLDVPDVRWALAYENSQRAA